MRAAPDATNRHAYLNFIMKDGGVISTKDKHFHDVPLSEIEGIEAKFKYFTHKLLKKDLPPSFKEFVHYRSGGVTVIFVTKDIYDRRPIHTWTMGWTDGTTEYLREFEFKSGDCLKEFTCPRDIEKFPSHFHPQSVGGM